MGPPQVPGGALAAKMEALCDGCRGLTVLLGVTQAYAGLGERLVAFDSSPGMISAIWPGDDDRRLARVADWRALPVEDAAADQVIGDGSLNAIPDRGVLLDVLGEIRRVLAPQGRAAIRVFVRPDPEETVDEVLEATRAGRIESLNVLRWRLASALAREPGYDVSVAAILTHAERLGDLAKFAADRGMDPTQAEHFQSYRGSTVHYLFHDRAALAADALRAGLSCEWVETRGYLGARDCPIALLRPLP